MDNMTAKMSCFVRAYHAVNNEVKVFDDSMAKEILGDDYDAIAGALKQGTAFFLPGFQGSQEEALHLIVNRQLAPSVLGRSALCEEALKQEIRIGAKQYVLFAAGLDTFGVRKSACREEDVDVFELDLPEMIEEKKKRIGNAGLKSRSVYVPCDLASSDWSEKLADAGFCSSKKTFGSLLGISYYLTKEAFESLLQTVGEVMPKGSALCFDYPMKESGIETETNRRLAAGAGETMKAVYSYSELEKLLENSGFLIYEHLNADEMTERFFSEYNRKNENMTMRAPVGVGYVLTVKNQNKCS